MAEGTKERILRTALELFAQNGYLGTSMNDIAGQLGITKAALYKHYASKQEILDKIVERMNKMDYERAEAYEMPEMEPDGFAEAYLHTPIQKIRTSENFAAYPAGFSGSFLLIAQSVLGTAFPAVDRKSVV